MSSCAIVILLKKFIPIDTRMARAMWYVLFMTPVGSSMEISMKKRRQSTKDNLIPVEKSTKVIKLDRRGKAELRSRSERIGNAAAVFTALLALACMLYCLCIYFFMGYGSRFFLIWGVLAVGLAGLSWLLWHPGLRERIPRVLRIGFMAAVTVGVLLFVVVEGLIFSQFGARAQGDADYMIVLGAQWKNGYPSYVLQKRLDAAIVYLKENPDMIVIVSGGQGSNEPISEAEGMAGYLQAAGIDPERIVQENQSTSTSENLEFSERYLNKAEDRVLIVTSNFHVYRAVKIAQKKGYAQVEGLAADSYPAMLPNNLLREFFGVVKDFVVGNM